MKVKRKIFKTGIVFRTQSECKTNSTTLSSFGLLHLFAAVN